MRKRSIEERFWEKVAKGEPDECWLWTGSVDSRGYGHLGVNRRTTRAHRIAWELAYGAIPDGLWVLHRCDVRRCNNPGHLFLGTRADNVADMVSKGRQRGPAPENSAARLYPERLPRGDNHWTRRHPERRLRGDANPSRRRPERLARGDRNGSRLHPESRPRGDEHWTRRNPESLARGSSHGNSKLTEDDVRTIRSLNAAGVSYRILAQRFGVTPGLIGHIVRRITWKHVA